MLCVAALWPYTYEPGGRFEIIPIDRAKISSETTGQIVEVLMQEGDLVKAGSIIVRLDDLQWDSQVKQTLANVARIKAELSKALNGATQQEIDLAKQQVETARARLNASRIESSRASDAHNRKAITSQERDRAVENTKVRVEELADAQQQLALIGSDTRVEDIEAKQAQLASEQAALTYAREQQQRTQIRSPIDGVIVGENLRFSLGQFVDAGDVIAEVENLQRLDAQLHLPEFAASYAQPGASAIIKTWARPHHAYTGTVKSIAPAAQNGENGRVVRVLVEVDNSDPLLLAEMSGQGKIQAGTGPALIAFSHAIVRFITVELWSWLP
jgi:multidrug resistance efflux pump